MLNATCPPTLARYRDPASLIFNLPGYDVIDAVDLPSGGRRVVVRALDRDDACPDCGVVSTRVHQWTRQRVRDLPAGGEPIEVVVSKPRMVCAEAACGRRTLVQVTDQLPWRARCLTRLREQFVDAVIDSGRAVEKVAASLGVSLCRCQAAAGWLSAAGATVGRVVAEHGVQDVDAASGEADEGGVVTFPGGAFPVVVGAADWVVETGEC